MKYQEFLPSEPLAKFIECYWSIQGHEQSVSNTVFPDGCMDIIYDFSDHSFQHDDERTVVIGNMTRPIEVMNSGHVDMLGVRFRPGGMSHWIKAPLVELTDARVSLNDLFKATDSLNIYSLKAKTLQQRISMLNNFFLKSSISANVKPWQSCLDQITKTKGNVSIRKISEEIHISQKQLERKFKEHVGLTPKQLSIVLRFRELRERLQQQPVDLLQLAVHLNYSDHAHLTKSFKSMAGITPTEYLKSLR
jgi:AraC-like DNA-binding protein